MCKTCLNKRYRWTTVIDKHKDLFKYRSGESGYVITQKAYETLSGDELALYWDLTEGHIMHGYYSFPGIIKRIEKLDKKVKELESNTKKLANIVD
jgi:hypothetical protein